MELDLTAVDYIQVSSSNTNWNC